LVVVVLVTVMVLVVMTGRVVGAVGGERRAGASEREGCRGPGCVRLIMRISLR
jgi:hypothetical protein